MSKCIYEIIVTNEGAKYFAWFERLFKKWEWSQNIEVENAFFLEGEACDLYILMHLYSTSIVIGPFV